MNEAVETMNDAYFMICAGLFGWICGCCAHYSSIKKSKGYAVASLLFGAIGLSCALMAGCITLERGWQERMQEREECYLQEGNTCLETSRRTAEKWGGKVVKVGGRLHTVDGFSAILQPSTDGIGHAFVLYKDCGDYWEIKDSNHGRLILFKTELDKVMWRYDEY